MSYDVRITMKARTAPLLRALERKGWNQATLALWLSCAGKELCGTEWKTMTWQTQLSNWVNLRSVPTEAQLVAIAFALDTEPSNLWPDGLRQLADTDVAKTVEVDFSIAQLGHMQPRALPSAPIDREIAIESEELLAGLDNALSRLRNRSRMVLEMYYKDDMTLAEIAKIMGISAGRVSQIRNKALHEVRLLMEGNGHSFHEAFNLNTP